MRCGNGYGGSAGFQHRTYEGEVGDGMILTEVERFQGERLPPWWYGVSRIDADREVAVFLPIPINFLVRWSDAISRRWNVWRSRP